LVIAITFHEASHGYVARLCGDDTAWRLGRVSFNPFKHIDSTQMTAEAIGRPKASPVVQGLVLNTLFVLLG
jgi:Zn-dependent protease